MTASVTAMMTGQRRAGILRPNRNRTASNPMTEAMMPIGESLLARVVVGTSADGGFLARRRRSRHGDAGSFTANSADPKQTNGMRLPKLFCWLPAALLASGAVGADARPHGRCLTSGEAWEVVSAHKVVPPERAVHLAHKVVPNGEVLRAALCQDPEGLVYRLIVLRKDGRFVHVIIEAPSGVIKAVH